MLTDTETLRYAAFAAVDGGGNPAGIVLDASALDDASMLAIAADLGYPETAFVTSRDATDDRRLAIRYFSPEAEVPFCGHATIATAVALAEREGPGAGDAAFTFDTAVGPIVVETRVERAATDERDTIVASFTSVEPSLVPLDDDVKAALLVQFGLTTDELDDRFPFTAAAAGNVHPVIVIRDRETFDAATFDPAALRSFMVAQGWQGTVTLLHATSATTFEARNPFPYGDVVEDPATGSAAAAVGGYLRLTGLIEAPGWITIRQGAHVGRPSVLVVDVPESGGIVVSGSARPIA